MKNKFSKRAHVSERKFKELLALFCEDLSATQIAHITGISRITINSYFKLLRLHIVSCFDVNKLNSLSPIKPYEQYQNPLDWYKQFIALEKVYKSVFGIQITNNGIYSSLLTSIELASLEKIINNKNLNENAIKDHMQLSVYDAIADFTTTCTIRLSIPKKVFEEERIEHDEIDVFWKMLKSRLGKFRGLNLNSIYLHVKETEFRYNMRNQQLYSKLSETLKCKPLNI